MAAVGGVSIRILGGDAELELGGSRVGVKVSGGGMYAARTAIGPYLLPPDLTREFRNAGAGWRVSEIAAMG